MPLDVNKYGKKYTCYQCSTKFYDLNKPKPLCPRCGADQTQRVERDEPAVIREEELDAAAPRSFEEEEDAVLPDAIDMEEDVGALDEHDTQGLPEMEEELGYEETDSGEEE